jgi:hypothetical protein
LVETAHCGEDKFFLKKGIKYQMSEFMREREREREREQNSCQQPGNRSQNRGKFRKIRQIINHFIILYTLGIILSTPMGNIFLFITPHPPPLTLSSTSPSPLFLLYLEV